MDGVHYSTSRSQESFTGSTVSAHSLSRLADFITQADGKRHTCTQQQSTCQECDEHFPFATDLLRHQEQNHTLPKPHCCHSCGQTFSLKSSLQLHNCDSTECKRCRRGDSGRAPSCSRCRTSTKARSRTIKNLPRGQTLPLDSSPYECVPCGRAFKQKQALLHHQQSQCRETPSLQDILVNSRDLPGDSSPVSDEDSTLTDFSDTPVLDQSSRASKMCEFCSETFCTEASLRYHKMRNHSKDATCKSRTDQMEKRSRTTRYSSRRLKSKKKIIKCRSCEMVFLTTSLLQVHRKDVHSREKIVMPMPKPKPVVAKTRRVFSYPCELCSKVFVHHLSLRAHYKHEHKDGYATTVKVQPPPDQHVAKVFKLSEIRVCLSDIKRVPAEASTQRIDSVVEDMPEDPESSEEEEEEEEEEGQEEDPEFPCPSCPEVFPLQWQLKEHMELHQSSARSGQCSVCTQHMDSCKWPGSKRQRLYHCVPCQQGFSALDSFLQHCQEHLRVRVEEDGIAEGLHKPDGPC